MVGMAMVGMAMVGMAMVGMAMVSMVMGTMATMAVTWSPTTVIRTIIVSRSKFGINSR
jgi:hypothetical protein